MGKAHGMAYLDDHKLTMFNRDENASIYETRSATNKTKQQLRCIQYLQTLTENPQLWTTKNVTYAEQNSNHISSKFCLPK